MKKIISNLLLGFSILLLLFAIMFSVYVKGKNEFYINDYKPFIIASGSMEPNFKINSSVLIKRVDYEAVGVGDVIAFNSGDGEKVIFHRIVDIKESGFVTKGDNNEYVDARFVTKDNFIGTSVFHTNITSTIIAMYSDSYGVMMYLVIPIISIICLKKARKVYKSV